MKSMLPWRVCLGNGFIGCLFLWWRLSLRLSFEWWGFCLYPRWWPSQLRSAYKLQSFRQAFIGSILFSLVAVFTGLMAAYYLDLMEEYPRISFDTVYRNLSLFETLGLIEATEWNGERRYHFTAEVMLIITIWFVTIVIVHKWSKFVPCMRCLENPKTFELRAISLK